MALNSASVLLPVLLLFGLSGALIYAISRKKRDYKEVAKVIKLIIYPIKSLPGIEVNEVTITKSGLKSGPVRDRMWILITKENRFITQRIEPSLALLRQSIHQNEIWIDGPDMPTLKLKIETQRQSQDIILQTKVWNQAIDGLYCGKEAEEWFSKYLNKPNTKLIQHIPECGLRNSSLERNDKVIQSNKYPITYHDGSPVLVINQNSITNLNNKLSNECQVSYRNFRPNILITDCEPHEEDNWKYMKIKDIEFVGLKPCDRCVLTTINPDTGIKMDSEPINTLKTYRLANEKVRKYYGTSPLFGMNFAPEKEGHIYCDDIIEAVVNQNN
ncbi:mitochondrial amidoxime reducing component 2-like [Oppia nitens]|uniref:mitochondrial amidoxime reducing component 2-like n=1 Tax=Oppia nitens TaxID=1686743 RepID=UPI0023DA4601|nr:mitochondrial amidoxime reducing component 2-like [Oppia nitens]